ncbi:MAG: tRNA pseudouridine(55) synthase TruB [Clostridia bacterium]|nr:tRNA pseudouridine(55) synthase TruB [Clostridia bacterium]
MNGILNINKQKGMTSSDVVAKIRRILGTKAIGHFGTLDPMGEGVLLMGVGKATRLFDFMLKKDKVYEATFIFGINTDTLDTDGKITKRSDRIPTINEIRNVLPRFIGKQFQVPPAYSAKSVNGKRAYDLAREGKEVCLSPCEIEFYGIDVEPTERDDCIKVRLHCSSGTYVRSFGRDLASSLDTYAAMSSIRRLRCGTFDVEHALTIDTVERLGKDAILPIEAAIGDLPKIVLPDNCYKYLLNGIKLVGSDITHERFSLHCKGELFGIAKINDDNKIEIVSYLKN